MIHVGTNERSTVQKLLEKLILEEAQFDVRDILPNTVPDPSSLELKSDYACPLGQVVMAPDCGMYLTNGRFLKTKVLIIIDFSFSTMLSRIILSIRYWQMLDVSTWYVSI